MQLNKKSRIQWSRIGMTGMKKVEKNRVAIRIE